MNPLTYIGLLSGGEAPEDRENVSPQPTSVDRIRGFQERASKKLEQHGCEVDRLRFQLGMAAAAQEKAEKEAKRWEQQLREKEEEVRGMLGRQIREAEEEARDREKAHQVCLVS